MNNLSSYVVSAAKIQLFFQYTTKKIKIFVEEEHLFLTLGVSNERLEASQGTSPWSAK